MWLLVGGDSEIGRAARRDFGERGIAVAATTRRRAEAALGRPLLDLSAPLGDWAPPPGTSAACLLAAVARLAACEADPAGSAEVNVTHTLALADRLVARGIRIVYVSTNQVFDGTAPRRPANDAPCPISEYGRQKVRTEAELLTYQQRGSSVAILRLSKVVAPDMALFCGWIDALASGYPVTAFTDMHLAPVPMAVATAALDALMRDDDANGIFQLSGPRDVSYFEVGRYLAQRLGADPALVRAGSAVEAGQPVAVTVAHTTLDSSRMRERFGVSAPDVFEVLDALVAERKR